MAPGVLVDASHDNSKKNHERQVDVLAERGRSTRNGSEHLLGVMVESNLVVGPSGPEENKQDRPTVQTHSPMRAWTSPPPSGCRSAAAVDAARPARYIAVPA